MPETDYLIAIDQGTTSVKAHAYSPTGGIYLSAQRFISTYRPQPDFAEQNPEEIFNAVCEVVRELLARAPGTCAGISLSCAMHGIMVIDEGGKPLTNLLIWSDTRSKMEARALRGSAEGALIFYETGTPIHPMSPLCKIKWLRQHGFHSTKGLKWASFKDFFLWRVTGVFVLDHSLASASGLFNRDTRNWSSRALDWCGARPDELPGLVAARHVLKTGNNPAWGIPSGLHVVVGASDGCLAQLGSGAMQPGTFTISLGTSLAVRVVNLGGSFSSDSKLFHYVLDEKHTISGAASNNGTAVIDWWNAQHGSSQSLDEFVQSAQQAPAGCEGLIFRPYVYGERAPFYDPDLRPSFLGLRHHSVVNQQRALLEGICFVVRHLLETVEEEMGKARTIHVSGGAVRSNEWMQWLCHVLDRPLEIDASPDASACGAAMLGWNALGIAADFKTSARTTCYPEAGHFDYVAHYDRFITAPRD